LTYAANFVFFVENISLMPGVFTINSGHTAILSNDAVKLCPSLTKLTKDQVLYIILAYDYIDSPWRRFPLEDRQRLAKRKIWNDKQFIPEDFKKIVAGIEEYKGLIYDVEREQRDVLLKKLDSLNNDFIKESDTERLTKIMKSQDLIQKRLDEIDIKIDIKEEKIKLKAGKQLSYIEQFQRNRAKFEERMNQIMEEKDDNS